MNDNLEVKIDKISIVIGPSKLSLSVEEARKLYNALDTLFGVKITPFPSFPYIPNIPYTPYNPNEPYVWSPITCTSPDGSSIISERKDNHVG